MPCYVVDMPGGGQAIVRGRLGPHCDCCGRVGEFLCDAPVGAGRTCDRRMCKQHAARVAPGIDCCSRHMDGWGARFSTDLKPAIQDELF